MKAIEKMIDKKVIIRADRAGVFFGTLTEAEPCGDKRCVELRDVRRLWYWDGAASITQLAVDGTRKPDNCKFSPTQESVVVDGVIEIHPCTDKAVKSIEGVKEWRL